MIRLEMELDDMDLDTLIEDYLPYMGDQLRASGNPIGMLLSSGVSSTIAKGILHSLSQEQKNKLAVDFINGNQQTICRSFEEAAERQHFPIKVRQVHAEHISEN